MNVNVYCSKYIKAFEIYLTSFSTVDKCAKCDVHALCVRGRCKCMPGYIGTGYECVKGNIFPNGDQRFETETSAHILNTIVTTLGVTSASQPQLIARSQLISQRK